LGGGGEEAGFRSRNPLWQEKSSPVPLYAGSGKKQNCLYASIPFKKKRKEKKKKPEIGGEEKGCVLRTPGRKRAHEDYKGKKKGIKTGKSHSHSGTGRKRVFWQAGVEKRGNAVHRAGGLLNRRGRGGLAISMPKNKPPRERARAYDRGKDFSYKRD